MKALDDLLRETMTERAERVPDHPSLARTIVQRGRHERRRRAFAAGTLTAATVAIGAYTVSSVLPPGPTGQATSAGTAVEVSPDRDNQLVSSGDCAGLRVVAGQPNPGPVQRPPLNPVVLTPGADNWLTMSRQDNLWIEATGPCLDRLVVRPSDDMVVRTSFDRDEPFGFEGRTGRVRLFTNTATDGTDIFRVGLLAPPCDHSQTCPDFHTLATVNVTVTGQTPHRDGTVPTASGTN